MRKIVSIILVWIFLFQVAFSDTLPQTVNETNQIQTELQQPINNLEGQTAGTQDQSKPMNQETLAEGINESSNAVTSKSVQDTEKPATPQGFVILSRTSKTLTLNWVPFEDNLSVAGSALKSGVKSGSKIFKELFGNAAGKFFKEETEESAEKTAKNAFKSEEKKGFKLFSKKASRASEEASESGRRGILSDHIGVQESKSFEKFYSIKNSAGGEVYVSSKNISQNDFKDIVHSLNGNVNIFTGCHGDLEGKIEFESEFYNQDLKEFGHLPNVKIYNMDGMDPNEMFQLINSNDTNILAWCYSELNTMARMIKV